MKKKSEIQTLTLLVTALAGIRFRVEAEMCIFAMYIQHHIEWVQWGRGVK